jgi:hypothetical protein
MTFILSIEETEGKSRQHGYHLGTDEPLARQIVEEKMRYFVEHNLPIISMALIKDCKTVDTLYSDGVWYNDGWWGGDYW